MRRLALFCGALVCATAFGDWDFDAGADLRIRQEIMDNVPGLPGGGLLSKSPRGKTKNHIRFRPRVWGEVRFGDAQSGDFRLYTRLADEFRANLVQKNHSNTFPDEVIVDNLFLEGTGLFDGFLDFRIGRQDIYSLFGLNHVFIDGTPGDGSRTVFADVARLTLHVTEESKLDVFGILDKDDNVLRWGTRRGRHKRLAGIDPAAEPEMDDWGFGAIWSSNLGAALPYQLFVMQKNTASFTHGGVKHARTQRNLVGAKVCPRLTEDLSLQFEGMGQIGRNGDGDTLTGSSAYAGINWRDMSKETWQPYAMIGFHFMSGDKHAADEDGGHGAWDPMWARGVNDSELFLYGTHYGAAWWSNMLYLKTTVGCSIGHNHFAVASAGPLFAAVQDGLGGGDSSYKGFLGQVRYEFPLVSADKAKGERLEIYGHVLAEFFNPGDYYSTDKPSWFVRWQLDFRF